MLKNKLLIMNTKGELNMQSEKEVLKEQKEIMQMLRSKTFVMEDYMVDKKTYKKFRERMYELLTKGFEVEEFRKHPVLFKFFPDSEVHQLEFRHFLVHVMLWESYVRLNVQEDISDDCIFDCYKINEQMIADYMNDHIIEPYRKKAGNTKINKVIHDVQYNLGRFSMDYNPIMAMSINVESFIDISRRNPRFNELIRTSVDESMQPSEIEHQLTSLTEETVKILATEDGCLKPILLSGTGIKEGQLKEFLINAGYKPDLSGNTIPIVVNTNFLVNGLGNLVNYYIDAIGGRKAMIMNSTVMGLSGHFTRMILLITTELKLNTTPHHDCGTGHSTTIYIRDEKVFNKIIGRYYRLPFDRTYRAIRRKDKKKLIGKTIHMRTPAYCADENICHVCYGDLFYTNNDLESIGGYSSTKITEPVSQSILSSKHLLTTVSQKIKFTNQELFDQLFTIYANEMNVKSQDETNLNLDNYDILINKEDIVKIDPLNEDEEMSEEFNKVIYKFSVVNKETGEVFEFLDDSNRALFLSPEVDEYLRESRSKVNKKRGTKAAVNKNVITISATDYDPKDRLFVMEIENNELTKPLYEIMHLLDNRERRINDLGVTTIDQMITKMIDLLIISKIAASSIHAEVIIRTLVRSEKNTFEKPDFKAIDAKDDIKIMTIKSALEHNPSVTISLAFQFLKRQLQTLSTYKKTKQSYVDAYFK